MKKSILLGILTLMCSGLAAQVDAIPADTLTNAVDSAGVTSRSAGG